VEYSWPKNREAAVRAAYPRHRAHLDALDGLWLIGLLTGQDDAAASEPVRALAVFFDARSASAFVQSDPLFLDGLASPDVVSRWAPLDLTAGPA
jgi:hypothetical protein